MCRMGTRPGGEVKLRDWGERSFRGLRLMRRAMRTVPVKLTPIVSYGVPTAM